MLWESEISVYFKLAFLVLGPFVLKGHSEGGCFKLSSMNTGYMLLVHFPYSASTCFISPLSSFIFLPSLTWWFLYPHRIQPVPILPCAFRYVCLPFLKLFFWGGFIFSSWLPVLLLSLLFVVLLLLLKYQVVGFWCETSISVSLIIGIHPFHCCICIGLYFQIMYLGITGFLNLFIRYPILLFCSITF